VLILGAHLPKVDVLISINFLERIKSNNKTIIASHIHVRNKALLVFWGAGRQTSFMQLSVEHWY